MEVSKNNCTCHKCCNSLYSHTISNSFKYFQVEHVIVPIVKLSVNNVALLSKSFKVYF